MKFKVGDRVAAYDSKNKFTGIVRSVHELNSTLMVDLDKNPCGLVVYIFHMKQCRKLKNQEGPRTVWLKFGILVPTEVRVDYPILESGFIEFREVRKKK